jgi:DNA repair exonuclease SbcCD ATPase subunit
MALYALSGFRLAQSARAFPALQAAQVGRLADSIYFLGFLWTLWALIDSFVIQRMSVAEAVFRTFGYALVTTASGMFLRLLMLEFQHTDRDLWARGDLDLGMELAKVSTELSGAAKSLASFREGTDNSLKAWVASLAELDKLHRAAEEQLTKRLTESERLLFEQLAKSAKVFDDQLAQSAKQLAEQLAQSEKLLSDQQERKLDTALEKLTRKLEPSIERLAAANRKSAEEFEKGATAIGVGLGAATSRFSAATATAAASVQSSAKNSTDSIKSSTEQVTQSLAQGSNRIGSALSDLTTQIRQIRIPPDVIETSVQRKVDQINDRLAAAARSLNDAITRLPGVVRDAARQVGSERRKGILGWLFGR